MSYPTCDTCKYWKCDDDHDWRVYPVDPETYEKMAVPFEVRYCTHPRLMKFERPIEQDQASCVDGSDYKAELVCGPKFGCIHHAAQGKRGPR